VQRPTADKLVVADAPGRGLTANDYPYIYQAHFTLTVARADGGGDVARIKYDVRIRKQSATDVPNTENRIFATSIEDLVGPSLGP
jgi:hypothetical protein